MDSSEEGELGEERAIKKEGTSLRVSFSKNRPLYYPI